MKKSDYNTLFSLLNVDIPGSRHKFVEVLFALAQLAFKGLDMAALYREFLFFLYNIFERDDIIPFLIAKNEDGSFVFYYCKENKIYEKLLDNFEIANYKSGNSIFLNDFFKDGENPGFCKEKYYINSVTIFNQVTFEEKTIALWSSIDNFIFDSEDDNSLAFFNEIMIENVNQIFENTITRIERQNEKIVLEEKINTLNSIHDFLIDLSKMDSFMDAIKYTLDIISEQFYIDTVSFYLRKKGITFEKIYSVNEEDNLPDNLEVDIADIEDIEFFLSNFKDKFKEKLDLEVVKLGLKIFIGEKANGLIFLSGSWGNIDGSDFTKSQLEVFQIFANMLSINLTKIDKQEKLRYFSIVDPLTKLFNRRYFDEQIDIQLDIFKRKKQKFSIMMTDIDHFKIFNDTYGHDIGDLVLEEVAKVLKNGVRSSDVACRFGGEEFIAIFPNTEEKTAFLVAERIRKAVEQLKIETSKESVGVTISLGVSSVEENDTAETVVKKADTAMYYSKEHGRNKTTMYSDIENKDEE